MLLHVCDLYFQIGVLILYNLFLTKQKNVPNAKVGFSKAMAAGWIRMDKKAEGGARVYRKVCIMMIIRLFYLNVVFIPKTVVVAHKGHI